MEYSINNNDVVLRLDPGDEIIDCILKVAREANITNAEVSGIGATDNFEIGVFNLDTKQYDLHQFTGNHEITNLCGSITTMNAEAYQHLHITCANSQGSITRKKNESLGINQWQL